MEPRDTWERIHIEVNGLIPEHVRREINDNFYVDDFIKQLEKIFHKIINQGLTFETESFILEKYIELMIVFEHGKVKESLDLMESKRKRYSNRPLEVTGQVGVLVRQVAKLCRLHTMITNDVEENEESLEDTKMDIFNYCIIGFEFSLIKPEDVAKMIVRRRYERR